MPLFRRAFTPQGAPPGALAPGSISAIQPQISSLSYSSTQLVEQEKVEVKDLPHRDTQSHVLWVDVQGLGNGTHAQQIGEHFQLPKMAISDVINIGQRPKMDDYDEHCFAVLRSVHLDPEGRLAWDQVSLFFAHDYLLTFWEKESTLQATIRERLRSGRKLIRESQADYLACAVLDAIVDGYFPVLEHFSDLLEELEDQVLQKADDEILRQLYLTKRDLAAFRRAVWPLREGLTHLLRDSDNRLSDASKLGIRDILDHTMQILDVLESFRELSASLVDVHLSMIGQRTNDVMKVLTIVSTVFIPLSFLAGVYGMNFDTSMESNLPELSWRFGYVYFWGICLTLTLILVFLFRRLGWLGRK